jgi:hypothetical protein
VPSKKTPTGLREGDQYGFDLTASRGRAMREKMKKAEATADERGGLKPLGGTISVPVLTPIQKRLLDVSVEIMQGEPDEFTFMHSVTCQCSLPTAKQPADVRRWERRQGRATLLVEAGEALNPKTGRFEQLGLPYGPKARLLLMHLNSEAVRSQSPIIPVEDSMTAFFRRLMGRTLDGRQAKMMKTQLSALSVAQFRLGILDGDRAMQMDSKVVHKMDLWFATEPGQKVLWPSTLRLSQDYYDSLTKYAVPLDERAIAGLSKSATALDIYCWLAQRLHRIPPGKPQTVPWKALHEQFGKDYAHVRQFRAFFLKQLQQVAAVYREAIIDHDDSGMLLWTSPPPVRRKPLLVTGIKEIELKAVEQ